MAQFQSVIQFKVLVEEGDLSGHFHRELNEDSLRFTFAILKCSFSPNVLVWLTGTNVKISQIPPRQFYGPHERTIIESETEK